MRITIYMSLLVLSASAAIAQQAVPPPPKPTDSGPTLQATMQFIQDKLNDTGRFNYASYCHDNSNGKEWTEQFSAEATHVVADPATCRISYHRKRVLDGETKADRDFTFDLHTVQSISVMSATDRQKQVNAIAGNPAWDCRIDPPIITLVIWRTNKETTDFNFLDQDTADRVARALNHAVELCGGGSKNEPF